MVAKKAARRKAQINKQNDEPREMFDWRFADMTKE